MVECKTPVFTWRHELPTSLKCSSFDQQVSDTEFQPPWYLCKKQIHSRTFIVFFLEILSYSGVLIQFQDFYPFKDNSILTAYFYFTLNHTEKNIEIAMSDKSTGSLPAFCLRVASTRYFKGTHKDLHRWQLLFNNMAIQYLLFF